MNHDLKIDLKARGLVNKYWFKLKKKNSQLSLQLCFTVRLRITPQEICKASYSTALTEPLCHMYTFPCFERSVCSSGCKITPPRCIVHTTIWTQIQVPDLEKCPHWQLWPPARAALSEYILIWIPSYVGTFVWMYGWMCTHLCVDCVYKLDFL